MKIALTLIFLLASLQVSAQEEFSELEQAWIKTGYEFNELFVEPDFTAKNCMSRKRYFVGCMIVLASLAQSLKEDEKDQEVALGEEGGFKLVAKPVPQNTLTDEAAVEEAKQQREMFATWYALGTIEIEHIESLKNKVQELVEANFSREMNILTATSHYGLLLRSMFDPRSSFGPASVPDNRTEKFKGIGSYVQKIENEKSPLFGGVELKPMEGSPAAAAGLKKGDVLTNVNGQSILDLPLDQVVNMIKGPEGTQVTLTVQGVCESEPKEVVVTRGSIVVAPDWMKDARFVSLTNFESIEDGCKDDEQELGARELQALYVPLHSFAAKHPRRLCTDFMELQLRDLRNPASLGIILDLRANPGGYLEAVTCMLDSIISSDLPMLGQFPVKKGQLVEGAETQITHRFSEMGPIHLKGTQNTYNKSIIVLISGGSASASEVFAGTIQDMQRGWVIGDRSVGKGSVQTKRRHLRRLDLLEDTDEDLIIRETTAIYTLPSGRSPQQVGIVPDFRVSELGEPIKDKEGEDLTKESGSFNSISFGSEDWVETRPEEVAELSDCAANSQSNSAKFKKLAESDERYTRPFFKSYQMELAKDLMLCSGPREPLLAYEAPKEDVPTDEAPVSETVKEGSEDL